MAQELLTNAQGRGGSRNFAKDMRALKMRSTVADQLRGSLKLILLHEKLPKLNVDHSTVFQHLKQIGKLKTLDKWVPLQLTANQKKHPFEKSFSLIVCNNNEPFLNWIVTCDEKWIIYHDQ